MEFGLTKSRPIQNSKAQLKVQVEPFGVRNSVHKSSPQNCLTSDADTRLRPYSTQVPDKPQRPERTGIPSSALGSSQECTARQKMAGVISYWRKMWKAALRNSRIDWERFRHSRHHTR